jgi:gamma-glutamyl hercynylcysteine S-oxide synthase
MRGRITQEAAMPAARNALELRHELFERLAEGRSRTDELFEVVKPEFLYERPIPERHRIIFYLGHLEAFDWNLLRERLLGREAFHPEFDRLFAFGIDPVGGGLPSDQPSDWPSLDQVRAYQRRIRETLDVGVEKVLSASSSDEHQSATQLLNVAIEHRLMHAETFTYMLHQMPLDRKRRNPHLAPAPAAQVRPTMVEIPEGSATLGLSRSANRFGWDNEYESHVVEVPAFTIDQYKVTNGQFLEFMDAGGYERRDLWTEADWNWIQERNISFPGFWRRMDDRWFLTTMFDNIPLALDWPVYVSHAEAGAYARWGGKSLPTEAQWHRAAYGTRKGFERPYPWGTELPNPKLGNFDFQNWDPVSVTTFSQRQSGFGVADLLGNGWEWTSTLFGPFPGFERFPFYPGYSADFFDGKHYVMKGGSPRTSACMLRRSFRNWFQPHYPYVYAGFRCVGNQ